METFDHLSTTNKPVPIYSRIKEPSCSISCFIFLDIFLDFFKNLQQNKTRITPNLNNIGEQFLTNF